MVGIMIGGFLSGLLSDRFGRKTTSLGASIGLLVFGLATAASPSIEVFTVLRCCVAICAVSLFMCGYVYCMEVVGGKAATVVGIGLEYPWSFTLMILPPLSWLFPAWHHLQLAISAPVLVIVILLSIPGLVPESPRWLLARGKVETANKILDSISRCNGREVKDVEKMPNHKESKQLGDQPVGNILDIFRNRSILRSSLIMYYLFFTNSLVYYGLTLNSGSVIPGNIHFNMIVSGALEILSNSLALIFLLYMGRKNSTSILMAVAGLTLLLVPIVSSAMVKVVLAQIGRAAIHGSFIMLLVYLVELLPTVVRNAGVGSTCVWARVAGIMAPYMGRELSRMDPRAPLFIFGILSLVAAMLVLLLPETRGARLPDTIEEGEKFHKENGGLKLEFRHSKLKEDLPKLEPLIEKS